MQLTGAMRADPRAVRYMYNIICRKQNSFLKFYQAIFVIMNGLATFIT